MTAVAAAADRPAAKYRVTRSRRNVAWTGAGALAAADDTSLDAACAAISALRKAKSQARLPMRAPVRLLTVTGPAGQLDAQVHR